MKYYFVDVGLRNARLNFRQQEENHIMENIIFNELKIRGYDVDVGVVEHNTKDDQGKSQRNYLEVDFVANMGGKRFYIQSALNIDDEEKRAQEINFYMGDFYEEIEVLCYLFFSFISTVCYRLF